MSGFETEIKNRDPRLYNEDLAPIPPDKRSWGLHKRALHAFFPAAVFSVASVWMPVLQDLSGYAWIIGAALGAIFYYFFTSRNEAVEMST